MARLVNVRTNLIRSATGAGAMCIVWDMAVFGAFLTAACVTVWRRPRFWRHVRMIYIGFFCSSAWAFIQLIDDGFRVTAHSVTYAYIIAPCLGHTFRVLGDIFTVWGLAKLVARYTVIYAELNQKQMNLFRAFNYIAWLGLSMLGLYQIGLLWALCSAWLAFSDVTVINDIARQRSGFEIGFTVGLWVVWAVILLMSDVSPHTGNPAGRDSTWFSHSLRHSKQLMETAQADQLQRQLECKGGAYASLFFLFCRTLIELIIVGHLDRRPEHIQTVQRARVVCYGLFSLPLCWFLPMSFPSARSLHRLEDGVTALVAARRAAGVEEVAERFEQLMRWAAAGDREGTVAGNRGGDDGNNKDNDGNNTEDNDVNNDEDERPCLAPETLLDIIEAEIGPRPDNDVYEVWDAKKEELGMLRHLYAGWEPIFKCGRPPRRMEDAPRPNPRY